jgi:hypothetical protein
MTRTLAKLPEFLLWGMCLASCSSSRWVSELPRCAPSEVEPAGWDKFAAGHLRDELVGEWTGVVWSGPSSETASLVVSAPTSDPTFHYDPNGCTGSDFVQFALPVSISLGGRVPPREALADVRTLRDGYAMVLGSLDGTPCGEGCVRLDAPIWRDLPGYLEVSLAVDGVDWRGRVHRCGAETLSVASWAQADGEWTATDGLTPSAMRDALAGAWKPHPDSASALARRVAAEVGPAPAEVTRIAYSNRGEGPGCVDAFRFRIPVTLYLSRGTLSFDAVVESFRPRGTWEAVGVVTEDDPFGEGTRTARVTLTFSYDEALSFSFDWDDGESGWVSVVRP